VSDGERSPGSREAEGEGGEGFYIAQNGRRADLLVISGGQPNYILCQSPGRPIGAQRYVMPCIYSCYYPVDHSFYLVVDGVIFWQQKIKQRWNAVRAIASIPLTTEHSPGKPELDGSKPRAARTGILRTVSSQNDDSAVL
jgi:hypothetical protein